MKIVIISLMIKLMIFFQTKNFKSYGLMKSMNMLMTQLGHVTLRRLASNPNFIRVTYQVTNTEPSLVSGEANLVLAQIKSKSMRIGAMVLKLKFVVLKVDLLGSIRKLKLEIKLEPLDQVLIIMLICQL